MLREKKIWLDGKLLDWDDANIHIMTHALHYGLAVFEGVRCYRCEDGRSAVFRLREHTRRLFDSAHVTMMKIPFTPAEIDAAVGETLRANDLAEGYIRPIAFIGHGAMGLHPGKNPVRVAVAAWTWGAYLGDDGINNGIRTKISSFSRNHVNSAMTKAKISGNYVNSTLAKREVVAMGYDEAILLDTDGYVSEGSGENIFIVRDGRIKTTPPTSILPGITRDSIMTIARSMGMEVVEQRFTRDELYIADEVFLTGTAAEITPVREVDDRAIGSGKPGHVTKKLQGAYFDTIRGKNMAPYAAGWLHYI